MNVYKLLIGLGLAVAVLLVILTLKPSKPVATEKGVRPAEAVSEQGRPASAAERPRAAQPSGRKTARAEKGAPALGKPSAASAAVAAVDAPAAAPEARTAAEKAVEAWEALVDQLAEQADPPTPERQTRVKEAFDRLAKEDQTGGIQTALNLLPDEQFPVLYGILFDKGESEEVLDAIFSDALNRPEEIKMPLMRELRKDREHPMFFESARILDVVEADEEEAPAPKP